MGRLIGAVVAGYTSMAVTVFALLAAMYVVLGPEGSFEAGSWGVSGQWSLLSLGVGLIAAVEGGMLSAIIAGDDRGPRVLAGLVLVLGLALAVPALTGSPPAGPRPDEVSMTDAMSKAIQPVWVALITPFVGAAGVLLGAKLRAVAGVRRAEQGS